MQFRLIVVIAAVAVCGCKSSRSAPKERPPLTVDVDSDALDPGTDPREPVLAAIVAKLLADDHLRARKVDDEVSRKAFERYLERLDPGKMYLLAGHVTELRQHADRMDDELLDGRLTLAREGAALLVERVGVVDRVVADLLAKPFDFTVDETIETDPDKQDYCADEAALVERWRKNLKLQIMLRVVRMEETAEARAKLAVNADETAAPATDAGAGAKPDEDIPATAEGREAKARADVAKTYEGRFARLADVDPIDAPAMFLNAITSVYDPHTNYLAPRAKENFDISMSGSLEGIGAVLQEDDHYITVLEIVPGGASWRQAKLEAGDLILAVSQEGKAPVDVGDMPIGKVVQMIRGPKGTIVTLTVQKPTGDVENISITRDVVKIETAYARGAILSAPGKPKVGYIYLPSFYGNTRVEPGQTPERSCTDDVRVLLVQLQKRGVTGVIVDLRGNGGGLLSDAQEMSGLFIERGPIVQTRGADGKTDVLRDDDAEIWFGGEVVVLVDSGSASASEILAAALQDYGRAVIVGTGPTHGKGTVQVLVDLNRYKPEGMAGALGTLKLTRSQFFRINGGSTQWRGVLPDVVLPNPSAHIESGERHLENSIPWSKVDSLDYERWTTSKWELEQLVADSAARVVADETFAMIRKRNAILAARADVSVYPLTRDGWIARRDSDRAELQAATPDLTEGRAKFSVATVKYGSTKSTDGGPADSAKTAEARDKRWRDDLARDPWVNESLLVLSEMMSAR